MAKRKRKRESKVVTTWVTWDCPAPESEIRDTLERSLRGGGLYALPPGWHVRIHLIEASGKKKDWEWSEGLTESAAKWGSSGFDVLVAGALGVPFAERGGSEAEADAYIAARLGVPSAKPEVIEELAEEREDVALVRKAKAERKRKREVRRAKPKRKARIQVDLETIEALLGEDFESLAEARRELTRIIKAGKAKVRKVGPKLKVKGKAKGRLSKGSKR